MRKVFTLFVAIILSCNFSYSQSWQWAKSGGSSDNSASVGTGNEEDVYDMATDPHGNIYVLATVQQTGANVDGHTIPTWGDRDNVVLTSFRCDGTYRWSKVLGNNNGGGQPVALKTDPLGGIYIAMGLDNYSAAHFDTDTTVPYSSHFRQFLLIKYDTAGHLKWFHWPESDTMTAPATWTFSPDLFDISTDEAGNVYMLCSLSPGANCDGAYIVPPSANTAMVILKYNSSGAFAGGIPIAITTTGYPPMALKMRRNANNGRFYITGSLQDIAGGGTLAFGGIPITHNMFVACFSSTGTLIWQKQSANVSPSYADASFVAIDMDATGDIYLTGHIRDLDTFNTYVAHNMLSSTPYSVPIIAKMDSNGNNLWIKNAYESDGETGSTAITVNGNEVDIAGAYGGKFTWPGLSDTFGYPINTYLYNVFVARFNATTGAILKQDTVASGLLENEYPHAMTADRFGNFYTGGKFDYQMFFSCGDTLTSIGGESDFFLAKYGTSNCSTPITTLETPRQEVQDEMVRIYPNPATNELTIENASAGTAIKLFNMMGQQVYDGQINDTKQTINLQNLVPGTYFLQITDTNGNRINRTVVKQ